MKRNLRAGSWLWCLLTRVWHITGWYHFISHSVVTIPYFLLFTVLMLCVPSLPAMSTLPRYTVRSRNPQVPSALVFWLPCWLLLSVLVPLIGQCILHEGSANVNMGVKACGIYFVNAWLPVLMYLAWAGLLTMVFAQSIITLGSIPCRGEHGPNFWNLFLCTSAFFLFYCMPQDMSSSCQPNIGLSSCCE